MPRDRSFSLNPSLEGQVEQWDSVPRKKDKKHHNAAQDSQDRNTPRGRSESRGRGRGGRGSRGGAPGRGGQNGHRAHNSSRTEPVDLTASGTDNADPTTTLPKDENVTSTSGWGSDQTPAHQAHDSPFQATGWGEPTAVWGVDPKPNGTPSPAVQVKPLPPTYGQPKPASKNPATSGLSWAEIARYTSFHSDTLSTPLIRCIVRKRNPRQHPLLSQCIHN